ncbi:glycoside hydrolase family 43 protein [Alicyclobacillus acidiphilus]|uniref:glycoside hydrolase family 43 protein n=1 Tax=Alicyclobacillus acidiphilus TaxID=182455 RepID=UPI00082B981A|nr:glycoside hydrolase family 43 protein [Alicyclobacillus acidiphilus]
MHYENPIIPGFYPDPSICRVGAEYYIVTSSFEYFPGIPIFKSNDMVSWEQIGYVLTRRSQLTLDGAYRSGGIFAPTIRHHNGRFYVVSTNVSHGGNFLVWAENPRGPWSDPIWIDQEGIDPSLLFDNEKVYFSSTGVDPTSGEPGICQCEIDIETGQRLTESRLIWKGTGGAYPEAPHLYRIGGMYYLMIAEGGTEYGHMVTIARSSSPYGPFAPCPSNPILSHRSLDHPIQATGHADLVEDTDGQWWLVCLGIRPVGYPKCHHLGRETFLTPFLWNSQGWPEVGDHGRVHLSMNTPGQAGSQQVIAHMGRDDFDAPALGLDWNFRRNPSPDDWSLTEHPSSLTLHGPSACLDTERESPAWVGVRQRHFWCQFQAVMEFDPVQENEEAGLTVFMNEQFHYDIGVGYRDGERCVFFRRTLGTLQKVEYCGAIQEGAVILEVTADQHGYEFKYGHHERHMNRVGAGETRYLSTEVAGGFTGTFFALYATGNGRRSTTPAHFDWVEYSVSGGK